MIIVQDLILALHLAGFAVLTGGLLVQARVRRPVITDAIAWGAGISGVSGIFAAAIPRTHVNWARSGVEFLLWCAIAVLVFANRRWESVPKALWAILTALCLATLLVAALWH